ncbi:uncharacterized protein LOC122141365 [Cyprinus carpio]|uniref:Uncharacterized protein LOC122141365 n=1 Tax=Cyprinus carpio TaxID=7962 RepID=A0A9Q9XMC2_CYPCA|nr:uncharacterized protein LOC122141365 [Cyprinus carpio]
MVGDSITLHVTEIPRGSNIIWKFGDEIIARMNEADRNPSTNEGPGAIFKDRLKLDETGSLTITNIRTEHNGHYSVDIRSTNAELKTFQVTVHDEMKIVSVKEGESVTLRTGAVDIQAFDLILWEYEDHPMAKIDRTLHQLPKNSVSSRFAGRLSQNENNGYLTISDSRSTDSGDYHLNMNNTAFTLQRTIRVTVKASPQSGAPSGICGAGVGLVVWVVTAFFAARFVDNRGKGVSVNIK